MVLKPMLKHWGPESLVPVVMESDRLIANTDDPKAFYEQGTRMMHDQKNYYQDQYDKAGLKLDLSKINPREALSQASVLIDTARDSART